MKNNIEQIQNKLMNELDEQFPKGECKERGNALVLFAQMWLVIIKLEKKRNYWRWWRFWK